LSDKVRVRIAPSPTGTVHLGLCRTALFNWAYARGRGGDFLMRIEDTDLERNTQESLDAILEGLRWLGIEWDEGPDVGGPHAPYYQSQRVAQHLRAADELLASGHAYRDFSAPEELDAWRAEQEARKQRVAYRGGDRDLSADESAARAAAGEPFAVRFRVPDGSTTFEDLVRGEVTIPHHEIDDWVMVRRGAGPTYNFVVVCDDRAMEITHVLRGEEHLVNTPKQVLLYAALGAPAPRFGHLPLMLGTDKKKLSKRTGDTSLGDYRDKGYPRAAIVNFLALQGWALDGTTEVFSVDQLLARFDIVDVSKGGAVFDPQKFLWMAGEYLRAESPRELVEHCAPFVRARGWLGEEQLAGEWFRRVLASVQERMGLYSEVTAWIGHFFAADDEVPYAEQAEAGARKRARRVELLEAYGAWVAGQVGDAQLAARTKEWVAARGAKLPELLQPLRCALSGQPGGPDLFETMDLLGEQRVRARIAAGARRLA
jgi:glutamyl-tRNA synthetase